MLEGGKLSKDASPPFRAQTSNALMAAQNSRSTNNSLTIVNVTTVNRFTNNRGISRICVKKGKEESLHKRIVKVQTTR